MKDDELDEMLIQGARDYHEPGIVPREEMWARIAAGRRTRQRAPVAVRVGRPVWVRATLAIAAGLILTIGIAIGRRMDRPTPLPSSPIAAAAPTEESLAYRLVVLRHLAGSQAMIATFRNSAQRGSVDPELARWSKELLSTTRLLEGSQASDDPMMQRLLVDLDLVISQIVQYNARGTVDTTELGLIEHSIGTRDVITKLRRAIPAGGLPAGT